MTKTLTRRRLEPEEVLLPRSRPAPVLPARQRLPDLAAVPASLRPVIEPMLQPRPEDRPGSMRELLQTNVKAPPRPARMRAPATSRAPRNWRRSLLIAAGVLFI